MAADAEVLSEHLPVAKNHDFHLPTDFGAFDQIDEVLLILNLETVEA